MPLKQLQIFTERIQRKIQSLDLNIHQILHRATTLWADEADEETNTEPDSFLAKLIEFFKSVITFILSFLG